MHEFAAVQKDFHVTGVESNLHNAAQSLQQQKKTSHKLGDALQLRKVPYSKKLLQNGAIEREGKFSMSTSWRRFLSIVSPKLVV